MAVVLTIILIVSALTMAAWIGFGYLDLFVMPASCPKCRLAAEPSTASDVPWYTGERPYVRCRYCHARFRESAEGTLVPY